MSRARACLLIPVLLLAGVLTMPARAASPSAFYLLSSDLSHFDVGCMGPCACPILSRTMRGSFVLTPDGVDPLYAYYALSSIDWTVDGTPAPIAITGSGRYQLGGEFALTHRLTLDLVVGDRPVHLDSGLIVGGGEWPEIRISCAAHGFACYDTVVDIVAKPASAGVGGGVVALAPPRPNPFRDATTLTIRLERAGAADLRVFDAAGRLARVLLDHGSLDAGMQMVRWDGARDDGRPAPAGLYLACLRTPEGVTWRRIVRLR